MLTTVAWWRRRSRMAVGDDAVGEDRPPVPEAAVAGQDDRAALVAARHDLEDPVGRRGVHGQVAQLVDDEHGRPGVGPHLRGPAALEVGRLEVGHEVDRGREVGPVAGLGGGDPEGDREVALADPRRPQEQRIAPLLDEAQGRQLGDDGPVDRGLEVELEPGQALVERVVGEAQASREPAGRGRLHLGREEPLDDLDRARGLGRRPLELAGEALGRRGQAQIGEVLADLRVRRRHPGLGGPAHRASSA